MNILSQVLSIDNSLELPLAIFFGVLLRRLIDETVHLLAGCSGQWYVVCICWYEL
jgi:hypothetical protein